MIAIQVKLFNVFILIVILTSLHSSTKIKNRSKRDMIGAESWMFCFKGLDLSYRPPIGLAAAKIDVLAFNVACTEGDKYTLMQQITEI